MNIRIVILTMAAIALAACGGNSEDNAEDVGAPAQESSASVAVDVESVEIVPGLTQRVLREGSGDVAEVGQIAVVHYTGWLHDPAATHSRGNKFDSSLDRNEHFKFEIGGGRVIRGWDQGVVGMRIGELRELTIAPELAYGERQVGALIPAGSTLVFEVELADLEGGEEDEEATP